MISENKSVGKNVALVKSAFREYYFKYGKLIENPGQIEQHEFGYVPFGSGMIRHLSFRNMGDLLATLVRDVPADVYCSNAYYRFPAYPMHEKQWLGADLIFDIDAKDLHLPCEPSHSYFSCVKCRAVSAAKSDICHYCSNRTFDQVSIPCDRCVFALKKEVKRAFAVLTGDLGIEEKSVSIYFSGNNGFHIVASDKSFLTAGPEVRSDIVSYVTGSSLMTETIGVRKGGGSSGGDFQIKFPKSGLSYGWRKMIAQKLRIDQSSTIKLSHIVQHAGGYEGFKSELGKLARTLGAKIDPQVTVDIHRIFRMPGTINSKSGLIKMRCNDLESFDPLSHCCLLGNSEVEVKVKTLSQIDFKLKGESFKVRERILKVPQFAAVYLICKGLADVTI